MAYRKLNGRTGESKTRLYKCWCSMRTRCRPKLAAKYPIYGGRGISVCPEWDKSYQAFAKWARANGWVETAERGRCTLDRIDVNGNYCPENCRFVDMKMQGRNRRVKKKYTVNGKNYLFVELAEKYGLTISVLNMRLARLKPGEDLHTALSKPYKQKQRRTKGG